MTNKRFILDSDFVKVTSQVAWDNQEEKGLTLMKLVELLNEQQATIKSKDKQLERLYNYFQDYLKDEMSGNAFSEMWDFVKEDESWDDE